MSLLQIRLLGQYLGFKGRQPETNKKGRPKAAFLK